MSPFSPAMGRVGQFSPGAPCLTQVALQDTGPLYFRWPKNLPGGYCSRFGQLIAAAPSPRPVNSPSCTSFS